MKKKNLLFIGVGLIVIFGLFIVPVYGFYFSKYSSSVINKFLVDNNLNSSYVRATVLTYWIDASSCGETNDLSTCDIVAKSSWNIKDSVINTDWVLIDGYYYYKTSVNGTSINGNNIKTSDIALIDPSLPFLDLVDETVEVTELEPQYEVLYEFIDAKDDSFVIDSWGVSYSSGAPLKT